jgi:hypothetical protein
MFGCFTFRREPRATYTLVNALRSGQFRRSLWKQVHIAGTTKVDMKRTYSLVYAIWKRLICKDILDSGIYSGNNND